MATSEYRDFDCPSCGGSDADCFECEGTGKIRVHAPVGTFEEEEQAVPTPTHVPTRGAVQMTAIKMVKSDEKKGKKFDQVAHMLDALRKSDDPVPFEKLCDDAGAKYPQDVQASMFALELTGLVERYTYVEQNSTRTHVAYKWVAPKEKNGNRPTRQTSPASKPRSRAQKAS